MKDSLRRWCVESLAAVRKSLANSDQVFDGCHKTDAAECAVNLAAYQRMLESYELGLLPDRSATCSTSMNWNSLATTCPLERNDPPETLGSIHEFLVTCREASRAGTGGRVAKPRKASGSFYTPGYVVDEIVHQTIGKRLTSISPAERGHIRILDPAAGCGFFLVAAFRTLIESHIASYESGNSEISASDVIQTTQGTKLTFRRCVAILQNQIFGVDADSAAIEITRRVLWLTLLDSCGLKSADDLAGCSEGDLVSNFRHGNSLIGSALDGGASEVDWPETVPAAVPRFDWSHEFPQVARAGGFDVIIGNPPYRREKDFKRELDLIHATPLGRHYRTARMDLWYYFLHRGIQLLKTGGCLSFITNAYWINGCGAEKLIVSLRDDVHLDEIFLLRNQPVFPGISAHHVIFRLTKSIHDGPTIIKVAPRELCASAEATLKGEVPVLAFTKTGSQLFREGHLDVMPAADSLLQKLAAWPQLSDMGKIRQGIAENPATINRRTLERFAETSHSAAWRLGEGVFSLTESEVLELALKPHEVELLRPYHDLCDLQRYWAARQPSRQLIYSTRHTCPEISDCPILHAHLSRFRAILEMRRETRAGQNCWWHLHWPRDDRLWAADKLVALQMASRPSFVPLKGPSYVPFSANVFVPSGETREDLRYLCGLLNSRVLWGWFLHHAKRRGVGLELNGHMLEKVPIRRIDFDNPQDLRRHDELVRLVDRRLAQSTLKNEEPHDAANSATIDVNILQIETEMDSLVTSLYGLSPAEIDLVQVLTTGLGF